jgi:hypothetical protein
MRFRQALIGVMFGIVLAAPFSVLAEKSGNGFLTINGKTVFPIGCYEMPKEQTELRAMYDAGFNLLHCANAADLDRVQALGIKGWISLPLASVTAHETMQKTVKELMNHPALAVWEGPDEVVWNFTAFSGLYRSGIYSRPGEWWQQTPLAVGYSEQEAKKIILQLRAGCHLVRRIDRHHHPIWINEAAESDVKFVRQYLDDTDITGCDIYPIHDTNRLPAAVGDFTARYQSIGKGKPVWMVLQGFSWREITPPKDERLVYPSFTESRFMVYDAIAHKARGILFWGTWMPPKDSPYRQSLFALVNELHALQPFLVVSDQADVRLSLIESKGRGVAGERGVRLIARRIASDWLIVLVNEDNHFHMGVEVSGLNKLEGQTLNLLYESEQAIIRNGTFVTRLAPLEVKAFASSPKWESSRTNGRDFK